MDSLRKVKSGDPLRIPAATFNTFADAAQDFLRRQRNIGWTTLGRWVKKVKLPKRIKSVGGLLLFEREGIDRIAAGNGHLG